jgi:hypothetical protein
MMQKLQRLSRAAFLAATLAVPSMVAAQSKHVAGWEVEFDGQGSCMMSSEYNAGDGYEAAVIFGINDEGLMLVFASERWDMPPDGVHNLHLQVDRTWDQWVKARTHDAQTLSVQFEYSQFLLERLARGNKIYLSDGEEKWNFTLHGTMAAIPYLVGCAEQYVW